MVYSIITSLAGKDEAVLDMLLSLLVKYLVEYKSFSSADINVLNKNNDNNALAGEDKAEFDEAVYDDQVGMMEMVLDVDDIASEMSSIRDEFCKYLG